MLLRSNSLSFAHFSLKIQANMRKKCETRPLALALALATGRGEIQSKRNPAEGAFVTFSLGEVKTLLRMIDMTYLQGLRYPFVLLYVARAKTKAWPPEGAHVLGWSSQPGGAVMECALVEQP